MKLALIPPIDMLDWTAQTTLQLALPHLFHDERYAYTYFTHACDPQQYVILDNGAAEDEAIPSDDLIELALKFRVHEVVAPDVIGDLEGTLRVTEDFLNLWAGHAAHETQLRKKKIMFVAQGQTDKEVIQAIHYGNEESMIDVIGLPRHLIKTLEDERIRGLLAEVCSKPVHLLGAAPSCPTELRDVWWPQNVRSTDTSSPFNFALAGAAGLKLRYGAEATRPTDYFSIPAEIFDPRMETLEYNVSKLQLWAGDTLV